MSSITLYGSFTGLPHCMSLCSSSYFLLKKKPLARIKINPWPTTTSSPRKCDSFGRSLSNPHPHPQNPKVSRDPEIKRQARLSFEGAVEDISQNPCPWRKRPGRGSVDPSRIDQTIKNAWIVDDLCMSQSYARYSWI